MLLGGRRGRKSSIRVKRRTSSFADLVDGADDEESETAAAESARGDTGGGSDDGSSAPAEAEVELAKREQALGSSWIETDGGGEADDGEDEEIGAPRGRVSSTSADGPAHLSHARLGATGNRAKLLHGRRKRKSSIRKP